MAVRRMTVNGFWPAPLPFPIRLKGENLDTVRRIKQKIEEETGAEVENQILLVNVGGRCTILLDNAIVEALYARPSMILDLALYPKLRTSERLNLSVDAENATRAHQAGTNFGIRIVPNSTLTDLREIIDHKSGVPPARQFISIRLPNGFVLEIAPEQLHGDVLLSTIVPDGTKRLGLRALAPDPARSVSLTVKVDRGRGEFVLDVERETDTVNSVKRDVLTKMQAEKKKYAQLLRNKGEAFTVKTDDRRPLGNGSFTLLEAGVQPNQVLFLE